MIENIFLILIMLGLITNENIAIIKQCFDPLKHFKPNRGPFILNIHL